MDQQSIDVVLNLPWYIKLLGAMGLAPILWKMVQGRVPTLISWLLPLALRGVDLFVLAVLAHPILRWLVIGNKDNFMVTANALLDGLEEISNAVQKRLAEDLAAAGAGQPLPVSPADPVGPPAPSPEKPGAPPKP